MKVLIKPSLDIKLNMYVLTGKWALYSRDNQYYWLCYATETSELKRRVMLIMSAVFADDASPKIDVMDVSSRCLFRQIETHAKLEFGGIVYELRLDSFGGYYLKM